MRLVASQPIKPIRPTEPSSSYPKTVHGTVEAEMRWYIPRKVGVTQCSLGADGCVVVRHFFWSARTR